MSSTMHERSTTTSFRVPAQRTASRSAYSRPERITRSSLAALPALTAGVDLVLISVALGLASLGRDHLALFASNPTDLTPAVNVAAPAIALIWLATIALMGGYQLPALGAGTDEFKRVLNSSFVTAGVSGIGCYLLRLDLARGFFVLAFVIGAALLLTGRTALRRAVNRARARGLLQSRVLIVGDESHVDDVADVLTRATWLGYHVVGALTPGRSTSHTSGGVPVLGAATSVVERSQELEADVLFFAGGAVSSGADLRQIAWALEGSSTQVVVAPSVTDVASERISVRPVGGMPLIHLEKPRSEAAVRRAKRTFDLIGSFCLLIAFSPVFAFAALSVLRHDRGPVFFRQERVGRDGRTFHCWKFRTMVTNAEELLEDLRKQQGHDSLLFKLKDDPRVTAPGKWLRRFSLDELPQLWNVFVGDMSLVGPRPPLGREVALYDGDMARRLRVRPGMTGLWQVSGRSDLSVEEAIRLDLYYVDNWSMVQDLTILARTFGAVFGSRGAY